MLPSKLPCTTVSSPQLPKADPVAHHNRLEVARKRRYGELTRELRILARRDAVCGMHVHVEVPRTEERVDLMNRLLPYMPVALLALSAYTPLR